MRRLPNWLVVLVAAGCSVDAPPLGGDPPAARDGGVPMDGGVGAACPTVDPDADRRAFHALVLAYAPATAIVRVGPSAVVDGRPARALELTEVRYGIVALAGRTVWTDAAPELSLSEGERRIAAFGASNLMPVEDGGRWWWRPHLLAPATPDLQARLGYKRYPGEQVGVVRIVARTEDQTSLEVVEVLEGELPERVSTPWLTARRVPELPAPGSDLFLASFERLGSEISGLPVDLRPDTAAARLGVQAAFREAPPVGPARGRAEVETLLRAWDFGRAAHVVRAEVTGLSFDNATGAGGMLVQDRVVEQLRGGWGAGALVYGGHAQYFELSCGAEQLLALVPEVASSPPPEATLACAPPAWFPSGVGFPPPLRRLSHTPELERAVRGWEAAPRPLLRLWPEVGTLGEAVATVPSASPLSRALPWEVALSGPELTWTRVAARVDHGAWTELRLELGRGPDRPIGAAIRRARAATGCSLPELREGTEWILPVFGGPDVEVEGAPALSTGMVFPGPWLPWSALNARAATDLTRALRNR